MRLLVYSQDGMGLGHLRRTRNIALELLAGQPNCTVLTIADSPVAPFFTPLLGMEYVKLPTIVKTGALDWQAGSADLADAIRARSGRILGAYRDFQPDVVLVDQMPAGALGELKPLLDEASAARDRPRLVLGLRDILDDPATIAEAWLAQDANRYLELYDAVAIYGCRDVFDAEEAYGLATRARTVTFCHYVAPRERDGALAPGDAAPFVLVMGGGGADAFPMARAFLDALPAVLASADVHALIVTGPNMPAAEREQLAARSAGLPVRVETSVSDATAVVQGASAVVTMGGYNSLCEVLRWRKRALVVPRRGPSAEQRLRARLFAARGLMRMLDPDDLTPQRLADELVALLSDDSVPNVANIPPLDGARRAAALLLNGAGAMEAAAAGERVGGG
jgi:predicted glycosyltransferase